MSTRVDAIAVLRTVADLLDANPDLPIPALVPEYGIVNWTLYSWEHDDVQAVAAKVRRTVGGTWDKRYDRDDLLLMRSIDGIAYQISAKRDVVCTRRVVGTETVTVPAVDAQPERTEEREVIEWDCLPLLADESVAS